MLIKIQHFVKKNQSDIVLAMSFILVILISFGAGKVSSLPPDPLPVVVEKESASLESLVEKDDLADVKNDSTEEKTVKKMPFVGSVKGSKFHKNDCTWADKIKEENKIWFADEEEAKKAGYVMASCCAEK